jgi:iron(III) transport system permease protein
LSFDKTSSTAEPKATDRLTDDPTDGSRSVATNAWRRGETWLFAAILAFFALFSLWPLLSLFARALGPNDHGAVLGLLVDEWTSAATRRALWNTIEASVLATLVSTAVGAGMAYIVGLTDVRLKSAIVFMLVLPLLIPPQITALSWLELTDPSSPILAPLGLAPQYGRTNPLYSLGGIVLVMGIEHSTIVFLTVRAALSNLPRDLSEAARVYGASPFKAAIFVIAPLTFPAVLAGGALAFVSAIGNFGAPAILGVPARFTMLTTLIYQRLNGFGASVLGEVGALALILALLAAAGLAVRRVLATRLSATIDPTGARLQPFSLKRARPWLEAGVWLVLLAISILPLLALVATSLEPSVGATLRPDTATLDNYRFALFGDAAARRAFVNSFTLAFCAACVSIIVAIPLAYLATVRRSRAARALSLLAETPYAIPGTTLAIGFIIAFLRPLPVLGISIYNTIWIILAAYCARFLTLVLRPVISALEAMDPGLDEAARLSGARIVRRLASIIAPAVAPSAGAGALVIFVIAFHELTVSVLLWSTGKETLGVVVFLLQYEGNTPAASALSTIIVAISLALAGLAILFGRRLPAAFIPWKG